MNRLLKSIVLIAMVTLMVSLTACRPADDPSRRAVGKWETNYVTTSYGSAFTMRVRLQMKPSGKCVMRTYNTLSDIMYEEEYCTYETKPNGTVWITFEDDRMRQIGYSGENMTVFYLRGVYYDTGLHLTFTKAD